MIVGYPMRKKVHYLSLLLDNVVIVKRSFGAGNRERIPQDQNPHYLPTECEEISRSALAHVWQGQIFTQIKEQCRHYNK